MDIHFYNTLTHQKERFTTIEPKVVHMYNCGPTVYDYAHIGNFRTFIFADVLRRFLELSGYRVKQVMNITDVGHMTDDQLADGGGEDKMAAAAKRLKESKKQGTALIDNPDDPYAVAEFFTKAFIEDAKLLGLKIADEYPDQMPRASDHVTPSMIPMIKLLIEKDHAYVADDGAVYFSVQSFPDYGKLSGNSLDQLKGGAGGRIQDAHQTHKRHPADFLLWKPDKTHLMKWDSPWGQGYPGWHIECSAMAKAVLGKDTIDIHTGGEDNIFPHHECEIAQSCSANDKSHFANFWLHSRFLLVEGEKMSKSKGNFHTVRDVLEGKVTSNPVDPAVLRYELLKGHYRSNLNFTARGLADSAKAVRRFQDQYKGAIQTIRASVDESQYERVNLEADRVDPSHPVVNEFASCLCDDLNVSGALATVFSWLKSSPKLNAVTLGVFDRVDSVLGLGTGSQITMGSSTAQSAPRISMGLVDRVDMDPDVMAKCKAMDIARAAGEYEKSDAIRKELEAAGHDVKTTKKGTVAPKRLA